MTIKKHVAENKRLLSLRELGSEFALSMNMSWHDERHCASPPAETKNVVDKSNVLGDVKLFSEE